MKISKLIPKSVTKQVARAGLKLQKNAPHILFGVGITGVVGGTVLACKATLKLHDTLDEFKEEVDDNRANASSKDMAYIYVKNTTKIAKLYAPAVIVSGAGLAALTTSHVTLTRRNKVLTLAYASLHTAFDKYRGRVQEEIGVDREKEIYVGVSDEIVSIDGQKEIRKVIDPNTFTIYSRIFDEANEEWQNSAELNRFFLTAQQNYFNWLLHERGHVFLNEVYERLGFEHSSPGSIVGWIAKGDNNSDGYIDFGMFDAYNARFINGDEKSIILDFNVDGPIWQLIEQENRR